MRDGVWNVTCASVTGSPTGESDSAAVQLLVNSVVKLHTDLGRGGLIF